MLWFHPTLQIMATVCALYVAYLGTNRLLAQHMGKRTQFLWKRHVFLGQIVMGIWFLGMIGGLSVARLKWKVNFVTGLHYQIGLAMGVLILFGFLTGLYMDRKKARRTVLPLLHGGCNFLVLLLAFVQMRTGWQVIKDFIL